MELFRALAVLAEPPDGPEAARVARALGLDGAPGASDYTETFVFQLYPYASVYLGAEGMLGGEARDRVAGFWRALGQTPPRDPDHLSLMLALYARLSELEEGEAGDERRRAAWRGARETFLWEHLLSWLPAYLAKLADIAPPFYRDWGVMLEAALRAEAAAAREPAELPPQLRGAAGLADPRARGAEEFLQSLLAPARTGMILTRADLGRAARELDLGSRIGERKFILKALMGQDARATLRWLAAEAAAWGPRHGGRGGALGRLSAWWEARALETAAKLRELEAEAWAGE